MDLSAFHQNLQEAMGTHLLTVIAAVSILALGWLLAVVARAVLLRLLGAVKINQRLSDSTGSPINIARPVALTVFWVILLFTTVAMLNVLDLQSAATPLSGMLDKVLSYLPHLFAGLVLAFVAWLVATVLRGLANKALAATTLDDKLSAEAGMKPMSQNVASVLFWLVILFFLPAILATLQIKGLLEPVQNMMDKALSMLPNVFAAIVIGFVGWIIAKVLRALVTNLLATTGIDKLGGEKADACSNVRPSSIAGTLAFAAVFIPSLIAALDALKVEAISAPATNMLNQFMGAVPNIFAAIVILVIAWYVSKFVAGLIVRLLEGMGLNGLPEKLGATETFSKSLTPARLAGKVFFFFAMLFATVEAANRLDFTQVRDVVTMFIQFGGNVLLGGVILTIGAWLANLAHAAISRSSGPCVSATANIARIAILGLVLAMGLRAMGIADDIVNLAFGLIIGAVAVAFGLAFGLGGREAAGKQLERWFASWRTEK